MQRLIAPKPVGIVVVLVAALAVPFVVEDTFVRHVFITAFIYAVIASNWDLSLGYAGIFNFGHIAFFGLGVYATAIASKSIGINPWVAILLAGVAASVAAGLIALPVIRLQGIYVVLVTFAFSQLVLQLILSQADVTGGAQGMVRIPSLRLFGHNFARDHKFAYYFVSLGLLVGSTIFLRLIVRSAFGLSILALRDNPDYAQARGISIARQRLLTLVASAFFTGMAGGFYACYLRVASPEVFNFGILSLALSMVLVGGTSSIYGPIVAALLLTFASEAMAGIEGFEDGRFMVIAVAMVLVLLFFPKGLASISIPFRTGRARKIQRSR